MAKQLNVNLAFTADTSQAERNLQQLKQTLNAVATTTAPGGLALTKDMQAAVASAKELQTHMSAAFDVKTGNLDLNKLNASLKSANTSLGALSADLLKAGPVGEQAFMSVQRAVSSANVQINQANGLLSQFFTTLKNTARWQISSSILHGFMGALQSAWGYAKDLDESLNNIRIVTGYSSDKMAEFADKANKAAKALNTTTTAYTDASLIYYQQGLSDAEVLERTNVTIKMANVAGKAAAEVSDQLTAIWNNFDDGSKSLEYYADVITALGAATASSTDEIAEGLEKFAAVAETVGLSYEYATAALATVTAETRQSADVVGTAFKTLFARLQDLELGETLDDGTTLGKYSAALNAVGINIKDTNGELKDMDQILDELGGKWENLSKDTQVALAQTVAGTRQYTQLVALMDNWSVFQTNLGTAKNAKGALQDQADIYAESWDAAMKRVRASAQGIYNNLFPMEEITKMANGFATLLDGVSGLVAGLGGLKGILLLVSTIVLNTFSSQIGNAIQSANDRLAKFSFSLGGIQNLVKPVTVKVAEINTHLANVVDSSKTANQQVQYFNENLKESATITAIESQNLVDIALHQDHITDSVRQYETNLSKINNIQALIAKAGKQLTSEQREQLAAQQQQLIALNEQHQVELEKLEALKRERELLMSQPGEHANEADNWDIDDQGNTGYVSSVLWVDDYKSQIDTYVSLWNEAQTEIDNQIKNTGELLSQNGNHIQVNIDNQGQFNEISTASLEDYSKILQLNEEIGNILKDNTAEETEKQQKIEEIINATEKEGGYVAAMARSYRDVATDQTQLTKSMKNSEGAARRVAQAFGASSKQLKDIRKNILDINAQTGKVNQSATLLNNNFDKVVSTLSKALNNVSNFGNSVTRIAQGFSSVAMGISSVKSAIDTLGDADATWIEKLSAGAMGATMGLQALMTVIKGVSAVTAALNTVQGVNNALNASAVVLSGQKTAAQAKEVLGDVAKTIASKAGTTATKEEIIAEAASTLQTELSMGADAAAATAKLLYAGATQNSATVLAAETGAKAADIAVTNAGTAANIAYAMSAWLACPPLLIIAAVLAIIIGLIIAIVNARKKEIEANKNLAEASRKAADEYKAEADAHKELIDSYKDALKTYEETGENKAELMQAAIKAAQVYGIEGAAVLALAGDYETLTKKIDAARKKELQEQKKKQQSAIQTTNTAMTDALRKGDGRKTNSGAYVGQFDNGMSNGDEKIAYQALNEGNYKYLKRSNGEVRFEVSDITDPYAMYAYYTELQKYASEQERIAAEKGENLGKSEIYNDVLEELEQGSEQYEALKQYIEEMRKTEMEWAALDAQEHISDGKLDTIAEYLKFEEDYLSQYKKVLEAQGIDEDSEEYKKLIEEAKAYVASLDDDIAKLQAEARGFDDLTTESNKEEMNKIKAFYENMSAEEQEIFWTMGIDEDTSLEYVKNYMDQAQAFINSRKLVATIGLKDDIISTYQSGDYKKLKELYTSENSPYKDKLSWTEFLKLDPKEAEAFLNNYELEFDKMQTVLDTSLKRNADKIQQHTDEVSEAEIKLANTMQAAADDISGAETDFANFVSKMGREVNDNGTLSYTVTKPGEDGKSVGSKDVLTNFYNSRQDYDLDNTAYGANDLIGTYLNFLNTKQYSSDDLKQLTTDLFNQLVGSEQFDTVREIQGDKVVWNALYEALYHELDAGGDGSYGDGGVVARYFLEGVYNTLKNEIPRVTGIWNGHIDRDQAALAGKKQALETAEKEEQEEILIATQSVKRSRLDALQGLSDEYGLDFDELEAYQELLLKNNNALEDNIGLLNLITLASFRLKNGIITGYESFTEWNDILTNTESTLQEIAAIIPEIKTTLSHLFNLNATQVSLLPADFIQNNWDILSQALQGSQEAYNQMQALLAQQISGLADLDNDLLMSITQDTSLISGERTKWDDNGVAQYLQELMMTLSMQAIQQGMSNNEREQYINNVIKSLGYAVDWYRDEQSGEVVGWSGFFRQSDEELSNWQDIIDELGEASKVTRKKLEEIVPRYKEIDDAIDDITDSLEDANRELDKLYGSNRVKQMGKVNSLIKEEIDLLKQKQLENKVWLETDRRAVETDLANSEYNNLGLEFEFDDAGNITNYTKVMTELYNQLTAYYDEADATGDTTKSEAYEKWLTEFMEKINTYEGTRELGEDLANKVADSWNEWQSNNAEALTLKMELDLSIDDRELEVLEYRLGQIEEGIYGMVEALGYMIGTFSGGKLDGGQLQVYQDRLQTYKDEYALLELAHNNGLIDDATYYESLDTFTAGIYENLNALNELDKTMQSYYADTLAAAGEEIDKITEKMENQSKVLDHYQSLMTAFGREQDYESMGIILQGQATLLGDQLAAAKAEWDMYQDQVAATYEKWQKAESEEAAALFKKEYEAALAASQEAQDAYLAKAEEWAEALKAILENTLAQLNRSLEKTLTGGTTFDAMNQSMERAKSLQEEYLTATNKVYETNKLMRQAQQEIDKTTNTAAKKRLQAYVKETQQLQDQSKLSQYELDIQQAKYDLLLAEIALEEAQSAKSTVRLQRDSEGNFGYVYTADASAVADAEQKLADAQNNLYNIGLEGANDYAEKYQAQLQEMYDDLGNLQQQYLEGAFESEAEYNAAVEAAKEYHFEKLKQFSELYQVALTTDSAVVADAWSTDSNDMIYNTETWKTEVNNYVAEVSKAFAAWESAIKPLNESILGGLSNKVGDIVDESKELSKILGDGKTGLIYQMGEEASAVSKLTTEYGNLKTELNEARGEYEKFLEAIQKKKDNASATAELGLFAWKDDNGKYHYAVSAEEAAQDAFDNGGFNNDRTISQVVVNDGKISYSDIGKVSDYDIDRSKYNPPAPTPPDPDTPTTDPSDLPEQPEPDNGGNSGDNGTNSGSTIITGISGKIRYTYVVTLGVYGGVYTSAVAAANAGYLDPLASNSNGVWEIEMYFQTTDANGAGVYTKKCCGTIAELTTHASDLPTPTLTPTTPGLLTPSIPSSSGSGVIRPPSGGITIPIQNPGIIPFDTGGYTGSWGSYGKLAMLHEKELVLNAHDTENFLASMNVLERILQVLDLQTLSSQIGGILSTPSFSNVSNGTLEQNVHIEASFPNATNHSEIEEAFSNLVNLASQYANRK